MADGTVTMGIEWSIKTKIYLQAIKTGKRWKWIENFRNSSRNMTKSISNYFSKWGLASESRYLGHRQIITSHTSFPWPSYQPHSNSNETFCRKMSWSLEAARLVFWIIASVWNLTLLPSHYCRCVCQISERSDNSKQRSRDFETSRDLTIRHLIGYWNRARRVFPSPVLKYSFPTCERKNQYTISDQLTTEQTCGMIGNSSRSDWKMSNVQYNQWKSIHGTFKFHRNLLLTVLLTISCLRFFLPINVLK